MQFAKQHGFIDAGGATSDFVATRDKYIFQKTGNHQIIFCYENPKHLDLTPRMSVRAGSRRPHKM